MKMRQALLEAHATGAVCAGHSCDARGRVQNFPASTLRALATRGLATLDIGPDGTSIARLTEMGRATALLLRSGNAFLMHAATEGLK